MAPDGGASRVKRVVLAAIELRRDPRARRVALGLATAGFVVGLILSLRAHPDLLARTRWRPAVLAAVLVIPFSMVLNAVEFSLVARFLGKVIGFRSALEVTVVGSAANLLPIPGGLMARVGALKIAGAGLRDGGYVTVLSGGLWLAVALVYGGLWLLADAAVGAGALLLGGGLAAGAVATVALLRVLPRWRLLGLLGAAKLGLVLVDALTLWLCLHALGFAAGFAEASVLTVSGPAGSLALVLPGGLGLREGTAALLGSLVGLSAAAAFLAASLARILGIGVIGPVSLFLAAGRRAGRGTPGSGPAE